MLCRCGLEWQQPLLPAWKSLISTVQQADNWSDSAHLDADLATGKLMRAMLKLPLLGRSALQASVSLEAAVHCYSLKFMLEDFLLFVACASCRHKRRKTCEVLSSVPARCNCISCKLIWRLRPRYMFIGPAPRALLQACTHQLLEQTLPTLRVLNQKLNEILCTKLCLYTPQCLPWTWRKFLFWRRKHADGDPAQHCKLWISERKPGSFEKGRWPSRKCFTTAACAKIDKICVSLQFRAIDPPNPARGVGRAQSNCARRYSGLHSKIQMNVLLQRRARKCMTGVRDIRASPRHPRQPSAYQNQRFTTVLGVRAARIEVTKGLLRQVKNLHLPQFWASDDHEVTRRLLRYAKKIFKKMHFTKVLSVRYAQSDERVARAI